MGIGGSILVLALGAILAYAVNWHPGAVNIHVVGLILMAAGIVSLVILLALHWRRRIVRTTSVPGRATTRTDVIREPDPPDDYLP